MERDMDTFEGALESSEFVFLSERNFFNSKIFYRTQQNCENTFPDQIFILKWTCPWNGKRYGYT